MDATAAPRATLASTVVRFGAVVAVLASGVLCWLNAKAALADGGAAPDSVAHAPAIAALRASFLAIAVGVALLLASRARRDGAWAWVARAAAVMLAVSVAGDAVAALAPDLTDTLGALDDVERRLFRLASMASRAVPTLALLALAMAAPAATDAHAAAPAKRGWLATILRFEAVLFVIGVSTLPTILAASAVVNREIAWALPIGADTTIVGCACAAVSARRRGERLAFAGWLAVCASMVTGLLMGLYAFGGPLPAPAAVGEYGTVARTLLRDAHIVVLSLGIAAIAMAVASRRAVVAQSGSAA